MVLCLSTADYIYAGVPCCFFHTLPFKAAVQFLTVLMTVYLKSTESNFPLSVLFIILVAAKHFVPRFLTFCSSPNL